MRRALEIFGGANSDVNQISRDIAEQVLAEVREAGKVVVIENLQVNINIAEGYNAGINNGSGVVECGHGRDS